MASSDIKPADESGKGSRSRSVPRLVIGGVLIVAAVAILGYYLATRGTESTDDANTDGRVVVIAPEVAGYITSLPVDDNRRVKAGDVLATIDPRDYVVARDKAAAAVTMAEQKLRSAGITLDIARTSYPSDLASARANRDAAQANLARAKADLDRQRRVDPRATTQQQIDAAVAAEHTATQALADADAKLRVARLVPQNLAAIDAAGKEAAADLGRARADLAKAELDLARTTIKAPLNGWTTKSNIEIGSFVQPGQQLMALVTPDIWITANFKESQLTYMRPGQPVRIAIDAFPQLHLTGKVDSIQMGSGARFSLFPAENATGNFIKVVQRVPVKILIDGPIDPKVHLPLGLSVVPTVDVR